MRAPLKASLATSAPFSSQLSTEGARKSINESVPGCWQRKWMVASQVKVSLSLVKSSEMSYSGVWISSARRRASSRVRLLPGCMASNVAPALTATGRTVQSLEEEPFEPGTGHEQEIGRASCRERG